MNGRSRSSSLYRQQLFQFMFQVAKLCIHLLNEAAKHCQSVQSQPNTPLRLSCMLTIPCLKQHAPNSKQALSTELCP